MWIVKLNWRGWRWLVYPSSLWSTICHDNHQTFLRFSLCYTSASTLYLRLFSWYYPCRSCISCVLNWSWFLAASRWLLWFPLLLIDTLKTHQVTIPTIYFLLTKVKWLTVESWWWWCLIGHEGKISSVGGLVVSIKPKPAKQENKQQWLCTRHYRLCTEQQYQCKTHIYIPSCRKKLNVQDSISQKGT